MSDAPARTSRRIETNAARAPIWVPARGSVHQLALPLYPVPFLGGHLRVTAGDPLPVRYALLFIALCTQWLLAGCPPDRRVHIGVNEALGVLGYAQMGGSGKAIVRKALVAMRSLTLVSTLRVPGQGDVHEQGWGLIDRYRIVSPRSGAEKGWVELSQEVCALLAAGSYTWLDGEVFERLVATDEVAARLYLFLETEDLPGPETPPWRYSLFSHRPGDLPDDRLAISDLVHLHAKVRRKVADRLRGAVRTLCALAPEYEIAVAAAKYPGMWNMEVRRLRHLSPGAVPSVALVGGASEGTPVLAAGASGGTLLGHAKGRRGASGGTQVGHAKGRRGASEGTRVGHPRDASVRDSAPTVGPTVAPSVSDSSVVVSVEEIPSPDGTSLSEGEERTGSSPRPDLEALLARGWRTVSAAQRDRLFEIADRHRRDGEPRSGYEWVAAAIVEAPPDEDPLTHLFARDRAWQAERRRANEAAQAPADGTIGREGANERGGTASLGAILAEALRRVETGGEAGS